MKNHDSERLVTFYKKTLPSIELKEESDLKVYVKVRDDIECALNEGKSWDHVITKIVRQGVQPDQEVLIDVIEHRYKKKVKNAAQALKYLGANISLDSDKLKQFLDRCLLSNREAKFYDILYRAIKNGEKYNLILNSYNSSDFGLPENWINVYGNQTDKNSLIKMAMHYGLEFCDKGFKESELNAIAERIEAPLSVMLEAYDYYSVKRRFKTK